MPRRAHKHTRKIHAFAHVSTCTHASNLRAVSTTHQDTHTLYTLHARTRQQTRSHQEHMHTALTIHTLHEMVRFGAVVDAQAPSHHASVKHGSHLPVWKIRARTCPGVSSTERWNPASGRLAQTHECTHRCVRGSVGAWRARMFVHTCTMRVPARVCACFVVS
jgi:hypothetical protein